jgi:PKD repeat protein
LIAIGASSAATAAELTLAWDAVEDDRVSTYELHYGTTANTYQASLETSDARATVSDLEPETTYFFAVRACSEGGSSCSGFSDEISATTAVEAPTAEFRISASSGIAPHQVSFTSTSTGAIDEYLWSFGDGITSTNPSPSHNYETAGVYSVSLRVSGPGGSSTELKTNAIQVKPAPIIADFSASTTSGIAPLTVTFRDQSSGNIDSYQWDFGDGRSSTAPTSVHTYSDPGIYSVALTVAGPDDSATETKANLIEVRAQTAAPVANFRNSHSVGSAPLEVAFYDTSAGSVSTYQWDFGDGTQSSAAAPVHRYDEPGAYDVSLTVTGPGGSDTITRHSLVHVESDQLVIEYGEILLDHNWQWIDFKNTSFIDPIVVVNGLSSNGGQPAVVRVAEVDQRGFWVRIHEWEYLDGEHLTERTGYIAVERGRHQLENGTWIEADEITVDGSDGFVATEFSAPFATSPVVLSAVASDFDYQAVVVRLREVAPTGFELRLQHEEALSYPHGEELITYIAWEPSLGEIDGAPFEAAITSKSVTDARYRINFATPFEQVPLFVAQPQTSDGGDTANLRWSDKTSSKVDVYIHEEKSKDSETRHTREVVGYISFGDAW